MSGKLAIALLVILVVLFVVGVGAGACSGAGNQIDLKGGLPELFRGAAVQPLDLDTVTASPGSCKTGQRVVVALNQTCHLTVPKAGPATRSLRVVAGATRVTLHDAGGDPNAPVDKPVPNSDSDSLFVYEDGGVVDIRCVTSGGCVLQPPR